MAKKRKISKKSKKTQANALSNEDLCESSLAKVLVDCKSGITSETEEDDLRAANSRAKNKPSSQANSTKKINPSTRKVLDDIWERVSNVQISFTSAIVGYEQLSGRAILDENIMTLVLVGCGYQIQYVIDFIREYQETMSKENGPIVMIDCKREQVYSIAKEIPDVVNMMQMLKTKRES